MEKVTSSHSPSWSCPPRNDWSLSSLALAWSVPRHPSKLAATGLSLNPAPGSLGFGNGSRSGHRWTQSIYNSVNMGTATVIMFLRRRSPEQRFSPTGWGASSFPIAPGQSASLPIQFAPSNTGATLGSLFVVSSASNSPLAVPLSGTGIQAALTISSPSVNFGSVVVGQSSTQTVQLTNSGTANLVISGVAVSGAGFGASGVASGATLSPNQSSTLNVQFAPGTPGTLSAQVNDHRHMCRMHLTRRFRHCNGPNLTRFRERSARLQAAVGQSSG